MLDTIRYRVICSSSFLLQLPIEHVLIKVETFRISKLRNAHHLDNTTYNVNIGTCCTDGFSIHPIGHGTATSVVQVLPFHLICICNRTDRIPDYIRLNLTLALQHVVMTSTPATILGNQTKSGIPDIDSLVIQRMFRANNSISVGCAVRTIVSYRCNVIRPDGNIWSAINGGTEINHPLLVGDNVIGLTIRVGNSDSSLRFTNVLQQCIHLIPDNITSFILPEIRIRFQQDIRMTNTCIR